jgi:mannose-6-phosphate isomerase
VVIGTIGPHPTVHIGFREEQSPDTVAAWVRDQDAPAMLGALNTVTVAPGDTVFVPAGVPHAIGTGVFIVELQQPTDLSVMLEWTGFVDSPEAGHLGIGYKTALGCLDHSGWTPDRLTTLVRKPEDDGAVTELFGPAAAGFFRAQRITARSGAILEPSYAVLVVLAGAGELTTEDGEKSALGKGDTVVVPHAAGAVTIDGELTAIRCLPPAALR